MPFDLWNAEVADASQRTQSVGVVCHLRRFAAMTRRPAAWSLSSLSKNAAADSAFTELPIFMGGHSIVPFVPSVPIGYIISTADEGRLLRVSARGGKSGHHRAECLVERPDTDGQTIRKESATETKQPPLFGGDGETAV